MLTLCVYEWDLTHHIKYIRKVNEPVKNKWIKKNKEKNK